VFCFILFVEGTGKTLLARACAKNTDAVFLKISGPQLVQMFIGDGAKLVRDAFDLAKEKIKKEGRNELDAIGTKRYGGDQAGDREVQRTMLELLNQLDGFSANEKVSPARLRCSMKFTIITPLQQTCATTIFRR
jgi:26S proteasome regulatory subunit T5